VKMGDPGISLIEKILFPCSRKLGGTHGMHLRTSADHSHLKPLRSQAGIASDLP
jgi:hypothetical protein